MLYSKRYGTSEPEIEVFGKPTRSTFDYARQPLEGRSAVIGPPGGSVTGGEKLERIYMVGGKRYTPQQRRYAVQRR